MPGSCSEPFRETKTITGLKGILIPNDERGGNMCIYICIYIHKGNSDPNSSSTGVPGSILKP